MSHLFDEVVIAAPGNLAPRRASVASPQVSWEINGAGAFSGFIRRDDLRAAGLSGDLKGYWLEYTTSAGRWGGIITGQPTTGAVIEIAAEGYLALVRGQVITGSLVTMSGSAGGLARRALTMASAGSPTFIRFGVIDEGGGPVAVELIGDVGNDILPQIAEAGDVEWIVTADRVFHIARRLGTDRSTTVRLVEDRHIVQSRVNDDLVSVASGQLLRVQGELSQDIMAFNRPRRAQPAVQPPTNPPLPPPPPPPPAPPVWQPKPYPFPTPWTPGKPNADSRAAESWQARRRRYDVEPPGIATPPTSTTPPAPWMGVAIGIGANNPAVAGQRHTPLPTVPVELTLANIDGCFLAFDLGDTIRIDLGSTGTCGRFRAMVKALDVSSQTLTVSGELLRDG